MASQAIRQCVKWEVYQLARNYSSNDFLRLMQNALLARYFHIRGLLTEPDFGAMKEARPDALFKAWIALPVSSCAAHRA